MEAVLARLDEEEGEINRQKRAMDHDIQTRYAEALRHNGEARDHCFESLRDAAQAAQDKLDAERSMAELTLHSLSRLANQTSVSRQIQASAVVLKDGALRHFQQLAHKTQPKTYFAYNPNDSVTPSLVDCLEQFMGSVLPSGQTAGDLDVRANKPPDDVHAEYLDLLTNANLRHDVTALQTDVEKFRQELASLQTEKTELQKDVATLQADNMKLRQDLFTENSRLSKEIGSQHTNTTRLSTAMTAVQKDVSDLQTEHKKTTTDVAALQKDVLNLQTENRMMVTDVGTVEIDVDKLTQDLTAAQRTVTDTQGDTSALRKDLVSSQGEITSLRKTLTSIQDAQGKLL
nr:hypothetical protein BaRGS_012497 [Batillaria attramentaria]